MNQSTKILGFLAAAFLIFITTRGELPLYLGFLFGSGSGASVAPPASSTAQPAAAAGPSVSDLGTFASVALAAL